MNTKIYRKITLAFAIAAILIVSPSVARVDIDTNSFDHDGDGDFYLNSTGTIDINTSVNITGEVYIDAGGDFQKSLYFCDYYGGTSLKSNSHVVIQSGVSFDVQPQSAIYLRPHGDTNDYIMVATTNNIPRIDTIGSCDLIVSADENLLLEPDEEIQAIKNVTMSENLTVDEVVTADAYYGDGGNLTNVTGTGIVDYCSITSDATSTASATTRNIFDEDNYAAYSYTENARSIDIEYDSAEGNFTVNNSGTYDIVFAPNIMISSSDEMNLIIKLNGVNIFEHDYFIHSSVDPVERTVAITKILNASDYLQFWAGTVDGIDSTTFYDGSSVQITKVGGGFSGTAPNITYDMEAPSWSFQQYWYKMSVDQYVALNPAITGSSTVGWKAPFDGTITYMAGAHSLSAVGAWTCYVRKNGVNTALSCAISSVAGSKTESSSDTDSISFSAGDILNLYADEISGAADYACTFSFGGTFDS